MDRIIDDVILTDIANSIRSATGETNLIIPEEMAGKVSDIYAAVLDAISQNKISGKVELSGTSIKAGTFWNASKVTEIDAPNVTSIGDYAFRGCSALKKINAPNATSIADRALSLCTQLTKAEFPNLKSVAGYTFYGDYALAHADFALASSIGANAFYRCELTTLILRKTDAICTLTATSAFTGSGIANKSGYVYVPSALVDEYKAATNWSTYATQIRAIEDYPNITGGEV